MSMLRNPTLPEVLRNAVERGAAGLRVAMPGTIERFDAATQTADVRPALWESHADPTGAEVVGPLPVLPSVPVMFSGAGGYAETWPVAVGDPCLVVFADRSIDAWQDTGAAGDPVDLRRHDLADGIAILGVRAKTQALGEFDTSRAVWGAKGPRIAADGTTLHVGVSHGEVASQDMIRGTVYRAQEDLLLDLIDTATTTAGGALTAAAASLTTAAGLNAIPVVGGIPAAPGFIAAAGSLVAAATALQSIKAAVSAFKAQAALTPYTTDKARVS